MLEEEPPDFVDFDGLDPPLLVAFVAELVVDVLADVCLVFVDAVDLVVVDVVDLVVVVFFDLLVPVLVDEEAVVAVVVGVVLEAAAAFIAVLVFDLLLPHADMATLSATRAMAANTTRPTLRSARAPTPNILNNYMTQGLFGLPKRSTRSAIQG